MVREWIGAIAMTAMVLAACGGSGGSPAEQPVEPTCDQTCDNLCVAHDPCTPKPTPNSLPTEEWVKGFLLVDFEYWPYADGPPSYPDDIGWTFGSGSEPAEACMAEAYEDLVQILQDPPQELIDLREEKDVYAFYIWNNDYTGAPKNGVAPEKYRHLWLYTTQNGGYLIKWISETNNDGTCILPTRDDLIAFATGCIESHPNCDES